MICPTCLALEYASDDQLRRLVVHQARQIDRLTGSEGLPMVGPDGESPPLEALLSDESVYRKPPRVAAPKLVALLADAGWVLVRK